MSACSHRFTLSKPVLAPGKDSLRRLRRPCHPLRLGLSSSLWAMGSRSLRWGKAPGSNGSPLKSERDNTQATELSKLCAHGTLADLEAGEW